MQVLDMSLVQNTWGPAPEAVRQALALFLRCNEDDAAMLRKAVAQRSAPDVLRACHRVLGSCKLVGALALAAVCVSMQDAVRDDQWDAIDVRMQAFDAECVRLRASIEALPS